MAVLSVCIAGCQKHVKLAGCLGVGGGQAGGTGGMDQHG